jgi:hypothetical protein
MKKNICLHFFSFLLLLSGGCSHDFLRQESLGQLAPADVIIGQRGVEGLLIGAYAMLDGNTADQGLDAYYTTQSGWLFGSIAGGDAHVGSEPSDPELMKDIEIYSIETDSRIVFGRWKVLYEGIARSNKTILYANALSPQEISDSDRLRIISEAKALRAFFHFEAKKMWGKVPYLDEFANPFEASNEIDIWPLIEADFQYAVDNLPETSPAVGRWNKWAAKAFLGKVQLYRGNYVAAEESLQDVYNRGITTGGIPYALNSRYRTTFDGDNDNNAESIMAVQYTGNDGSAGYNASGGEVLNFPHNGGFGSPSNCCGFYQPSHEFVNSFRTDVDGLPLLDGSYNDKANEVSSDEVMQSNGSIAGIETGETSVLDDDGITPIVLIQDNGNLDPRLDWIVGRRGIPYLDWGIHPGKAWIRNMNWGGPFSPKKHVYNKADIGTYTDPMAWSSNFATNNYYLMRFADLILLLAEAKIEKPSPDLMGALALVNQVRTRASNPDGFVINSPANYVIGLYSVFSTQDEARAAVRMERKLELGMEGHRFFDLVRWGSAQIEINAYLNYEKKWRKYLADVVFSSVKNNYYPIPQHDIDLMGGKLTQNR